MTDVEVGSHLNGDESMALGSAFIAANKSDSYRVKPIWMLESFPGSIETSVTVGGSWTENKVFKEARPFGTKEKHCFPHKGDFVVDFFYHDPETQKQLPIFNVQVTNFTETLQNM
jgi:hypoxia up-regulated 1